MAAIKLKHRPRVVVEKHPNPEIRTFHMNERFSEAKLYDSISGLAALAYREDDTPASTIRLAKKFYEIDGVASVSLDIHEVRIAKGRAYEWDGIQEKVLDYIKRELGWKETFSGQILRQARIARIFCKNLIGSLSQHISGTVDVVVDNGRSKESSYVSPGFPTSIRKRAGRFVEKVRS